MHNIPTSLLFNVGIFFTVQIYCYIYLLLHRESVNALIGISRPFKKLINRVQVPIPYKIHTGLTRKIFLNPIAKLFENFVFS